MRHVILAIFLAFSTEDLSAWEPFWLPARATQGEWLGIDLDAGAQWEAAARHQNRTTSWQNELRLKMTQVKRDKTLDPQNLVILFVIEASNVVDLFDLQLGELGQHVAQSKLGFPKLMEWSVWFACLQMIGLSHWS